jgi:hypothetical protein
MPRQTTGEDITAMSSMTRDHERKMTLTSFPESETAALAIIRPKIVLTTNRTTSDFGQLTQLGAKLRLLFETHEDSNNTDIEKYGLLGSDAVHLEESMTCQRNIASIFKIVKHAQQETCKRWQ